MEINNENSINSIITTKWINLVSNDECSSHLKYIPQLFVNSQNNTLYIRTKEFKVDDNLEVIPLQISNIEEAITIQCSRDSCYRRLAAWHTTSWSSVSLFDYYYYFINYVLFKKILISKFVRPK